MILLDTNVVSELMRPEPTAAVLDWVDRQDATDLYLSAVSAAELRTGVALLPPGRRRDRLLAALEAMIEHDFSGRLPPFDSPAALRSPACGRVGFGAGLSAPSACQ